MQTVPAHRLIFVDEFGTHLGLSRFYGRAPSGERAYGSAPYNTDPNITRVMGLSGRAGTLCQRASVSTRRTRSCRP